MPRRALMPRYPLIIALAAGTLTLPAAAQEAPTPATPPILLPAPTEADANSQTTPETVRPAGGSGCGHEKAVTS